LIFRTWTPSEPLERGIGGIPVPTGGDTVVPDILLAPVVGFDSACFRLGYGGGYFDRTLAAVRCRPRVFGVGYACLRIPTIHPQPHDVPMDVVVTEESPAPVSARNGESPCL
jgi:5,10-methenyltetrahydrofolate synthetase